MDINAEQENPPIRELPRFVPPSPTNDYDSAPEKPPILEEDPETHRRLLQTTTDFELPSGVTAPPLRNENHAFVLVNFTHRGHRPKSLYSGFRILGAFPDEDVLKRHIAQHYEGDDCSLFVLPVHQLTPICSSLENQQNVEYNKTQIETLVRLHSELVDASNKDFKKNVEDAKTGKTGKSLFARKYRMLHDKSTAEPKETFDNLKKTSTLSATCCIAKQNFAAIIILSDIRPDAHKKDKEPVMAILDIFDTEEDCSNYAKYTASKQYPKCAIDVVDMYSWCFPENIDIEQIKEVYGNAQLNDIMQGRKDQQQTTSKFEEWCKENNIQPTVTEVEDEVSNPLSVDEQLKKKEAILTFNENKAD
jgi:hypothetical protein